MLTTENCERALVETILADGGLETSVEDLLSHLLSDLSGYRTHSTDGVILEYSRVAAGRMMVSGVVFMIDDQAAEPLRVELTLDVSGAKVLAGSVFFGDKTRTAHGSRDARKIRNSVIANPLVEFSWKECFHRGGDGWQRRDT